MNGDINLVISTKYAMRNFIDIISESFGSTEHLYHGLSIDSLWLVLKSGHLTTSINGWGHSGPEGVCLTRSFRVAAQHSGSQTDNLADSFFEYFDLGDAPDLSYAVLEFDRSKITNEIIPYDDFAVGVNDSGEGQEEEERAIGDLSLSSLVGIYVKPEDIKTFMQYAVEAHKKGGNEYDADFRKIMSNLLHDPRLKAF